VTTATPRPDPPSSSEAEATSPVASAALGNLLVQGDAAAVLAELEPELAGQVRCIYIDPPYGTGLKADAGGVERPYDDDLTHDAWWAMMRPLLPRFHELLRADGSLFVQLDEHQLDYMKVALDGVFGRNALLNRITVAARSPSSFSTVNRGVFKSSEYLLWYARDRRAFTGQALRVPRAPDRAYGLWLENPEDAYTQWRFVPLAGVCGPDRDAFQVKHAARVCRLATISDRKAGKAAVALKAASRAEPARVHRLERPERPPIYALRGQQLLFYDRQVQVIDGRRAASRPLTDIWTDIPWEGIAHEGGVTWRKGKKPERLIRRCLQLATVPGDLVLDCFLGSGTTAAVAHKMGRRWVGIEAGPQIALARQRLDAVVAGVDATGVTRLERWKGGGAFVCRT